MSEFGITQAQIRQIAAVWRRRGAELDALTPPAPPPTDSCRSLAALADFCSRLGPVTDADAGRLARMAAALQRFDALTEQSDDRSAVALGAVSRPIR